MNYSSPLPAESDWTDEDEAREYAESHGMTLEGMEEEAEINRWYDSMGEA